MRTLHRLFTIG